MFGRYFSHSCTHTLITCICDELTTKIKKIEFKLRNYDNILKIRTEYWLLDVILTECNIVFIPYPDVAYILSKIQNSNIKLER